MPIYPNTPAPFQCSICNRQRPIPWQSPQFRDRPPLCWTCEQELGTGPYGIANPDQRVIKQISALIAAIEIDAYRIERKMGPLYG